MATLLVIRASSMYAAPADELESGDSFATPEDYSGRIGFAFDDTDEEAVITGYFEMPDTFTGSGLTAVLHGFFKTENTASKEAVYEVFVEAVTPDSDTLDMEATTGWGSANSVEIDPPSTAGDPFDMSIALTNNDSVAAGDLMRLGLRRDTNAGADQAGGDCVILAVSLEDDG